MDKANKRFLEMTESPISKIIPKLAIPSIISMIITAIYNMADTFFVGKINNEASGAVGVVLSLMSLIQAFGFLAGIGSGNNLSISLGNKDEKLAQEYSALGFTLAFSIGVVIAVLGNIFIEPLAILLGSTKTILPYAISYMRFILVGAPFIASSFCMNCLMRFQGNSLYSMFGIGFGGILNIFLDPLFMFVFDLGIAGAAIATAISQAVSFCILFYFCTSKFAICKLDIRKLKITNILLNNTIRLGFPSLSRQSIGCIAIIILNHCAGPFGDAAIAALGIVSKILNFLSSALIGFGQGFQPVCAYNYGAKKFSRVKESFFFCVKIATAFLIIIALLAFIFAPQIVKEFRDDPDVIEIGTLSLRFECIVLPFIGYYILNNMLTQNLGKAFRATILSLARQGIFFIPFVLIFPIFFKLLGLQLAQPLSEFCSFLMAFYCNNKTFKELAEEERLYKLEVNSNGN